MLYVNNNRAMNPKSIILTICGAIVFLVGFYVLGPYTVREKQTRRQPCNFHYCFPTGYARPRRIHDSRTVNRLVGSTGLQD